jgi:hypothetical protein
MLTSDSDLLSGFHDSSAALEAARGHLISAKGIGEPIVTKFLAAVPGMDSLTSSKGGYKSRLSICCFAEASASVSLLASKAKALCVRMGR